MTAIDGRRVGFALVAADAVEAIGRGRHRRFVVDTATTARRIAAKAAKIAPKP